jgi:hypothetical protein
MGAIGIMADASLASHIARKLAEVDEGMRLEREATDRAQRALDAHKKARWAGARKCERGDR